MKKLFVYCAMMFAATAAFAQYPTNGLVAYFPLNGDGNDVGPNSIAPAYYDGTTVANRNSEANKSVAFVAANLEYIEYDMAANSALQVDGDFTVCFWAKATTGFTSGEMLLSLGGKIEFSINANQNGSGTLLSAIATSTGGGTGYNQVANPTAWNHYLFTRTGGSTSFYLNNTWYGSSSGGGTITYDSNPILRIARDQSGAGYFNGTVDDVFIYNRALDATERANVVAEGVCNAITQPVTASASSIYFCAGVPVEYTLSNLPQYATDYSVEGLNGWTGTLNGNVLTATPPLAPVSSPPQWHYGFNISSTNECSTGPVTQLDMVVWTPPAPFAISGPTTGCVGNAGAYSVDPAYGTTITWDYPAGWVTTNIFPNNNGGFFTQGDAGYVVFTKTNACFAQSDSIYANVQQSAPTAPVFASGDQTLCQGVQQLLTFTLDSTALGNTFVLTAGGSGWQTVADTDTSLFITSSYASGPYTLTSTASNSCGYTATAVTLTSSIPLNPSDYASWYWTEDGLYIYNYSPNLVSYQWLLEGQPIQGATGELYIPTTSGNYSLLVTGIEVDCPTGPPYTTQSEFVEAMGTVGVNQAATSNMSIYPNPFNTEFVIETTELTSISVMNAMGEVVLTRTINGRTSIDATALSAGIYFVREETSGAVMKLVKN